MASKVPNDPTLAKETGRFLDGLARTTDTLTTDVTTLQTTVNAIAFASQAEAEAGVNTVHYMNPLRTAQAIAALAPASGIQLIAGGSVGTGTSIAYTNLTPCQIYFISLDNISHNSGSNQNFHMEISSDNGGTYGATINITQVGGAAVAFVGLVVILGVGQASTNKTVASMTATNIVTSETVKTGITNALRFSPSGGNFDGGNIYIFGS